MGTAIPAGLLTDRVFIAGPVDPLHIRRQGQLIKGPDGNAHSRLLGKIKIKGASACGQGATALGRSIDISPENLSLQAVEIVASTENSLPLCMYCKQIRDDSRYWSQVELYVSDHSEAQFSHSICPKCMAQHYPDEESDE